MKRLFYSMGKAQVTIVILMSVVIISALLALGSPAFEPATGPGYDLQDNIPRPSRTTLQIDTIGRSTVPPTPTLTPAPIPITFAPTQAYCAKEAPKLPTCECIPVIEQELLLCRSDASTCPGNYGQLGPGENGFTFIGCIYFPTQPGFTARINDPECTVYCVGKPVIYLYPTKPTFVDVRLQIPGKIVESIPLYPEASGWQNVLAHPDGLLQYQGNLYHELYYESAVNFVQDPGNGIIIPTSQLKQKLTEITHTLGLIPMEQAEFLEYWLPRLYKLDSPYILFSLLDTKEKERVDHVEITPPPDTKIEFLAYFKPISAQHKVNSLNLPTTPPKRIGFTSVEWGGTIAPE